MKKIGLMVIVAGIAIAVLAAPNGYFKKNSDGTIDVVASEAELASMTLTGTATVGDLVADSVKFTKDAVSVTNGQEIALDENLIVLDGIGGANDTTNTITIATPYPENQIFNIVVDPDSTNLVLVADSTTVLALGADQLLDGTDTLVIMTYGTNTASKIGGNNN